MPFQSNFSRSLLLTVYFSNGRAVLLVFRQNPLLLASERIEFLRFNNLAIPRGMDAFANCIKNQFTMLAAISVDENEITPGFE